MQARSAEIAIIGAGPAGAHLASRLAAEGRDVVLFDPKGAWEKPCGGGVPTRAIREFAFMLESSSYPRKLVRQITMISPLERRVTLTLDQPFAVYSRQVLNSLVLDRAVEAGAVFVREGVSGFARERDGWTISTDGGIQWRVKFLVGADGASSSTRRRLIGIFPKRDLALAFGYNVDVQEPATSNPVDRPAAPRAEAVTDEVVMRFPKDFTGYIWAFPRPNVMNFGVASKLGERTSDELRTLLTDFVRDYYHGEMPETSRMTFFGAKIPVLDRASWRDLRATGDGWALVGDAAGFVDPITGEGIYYALRSADLLAEALATSAGSTDKRQRNGQPSEHRRSVRETRVYDGGYAQAQSDYEAGWRQAFGLELERAAQMLPRFYRGYFLGHRFTDATIRIARHHEGVRTVLMRLIVGDQSYLTLKRDLMRSAWRIV
jgi:geranylgeranyl reductase family protein